MTDNLRAIFHAGIMRPSPLAKYQEGEGRQEAGDGLRFVAGRSGGGSYAIVFAPIEPEAFFARATAFYGEGSDYSVEIEAGAASSLEESLLERGWQLEEEEPGLVLSPIPAEIPPAPGELSIALVEDETQLATFLSLSQTGHRHIPSLAAAMDPAVALLIGTVDGKPVATARLSKLDDIADIMGINTLPEARRRGYGTAMTWAAIAEGARRGCTSAILTATEMGYPVYVKMGFQPVGVWREYAQPEG